MQQHLLSVYERLDAWQKEACVNFVPPSRHTRVEKQEPQLNKNNWFFYINDSPRFSRDPVAIGASALAGRRWRRWWYLGVFADRRCSWWWLPFRRSSLGRHRPETLGTSRPRAVLRTRFRLRLNLVARLLRIVATTRHDRLQFFARRRWQQCSVTYRVREHTELNVDFFYS